MESGHGGACSLRLAWPGLLPHLAFCFAFLPCRSVPCGGSVLLSTLEGSQPVSFSSSPSLLSSATSQLWKEVQLVVYADPCSSDSPLNVSVVFSYLKPRRKLLLFCSGRDQSPLRCDCRMSGVDSQRLRRNSCCKVRVRSGFGFMS